MIDILNQEESTYVHGYMSNAGMRMFGIQSHPPSTGGSAQLSVADNILMTVGAAGALNVIFKTLLNPGDEVIALAPYFLEYGNYVENYDGVLVAVPPNMSGFQPDPAALHAAVTPKTRAVHRQHANNPTGVVYSEETIRRIAAVLEERQKEFGTSIYLISDEPYRELAYDGVIVPYLTKYYRNTIIGLLLVKIAVAARGAHRVPCHPVGD